MGVAEIREEALKPGDWDRMELTGKGLDSLEGADPNDCGTDGLGEARIGGDEFEIR